jgi:hypothetical protein
MLCDDLFAFASGNCDDALIIGLKERRIGLTLFSVLHRPEQPDGINASV